MSSLDRTPWILALGVGLTLAPACKGPAGPSNELGLPQDDFELPPPDTSLDPGRLAVGTYIATPCDLYPMAGRPGDGFAHLRDRHEWALVDVFFGRDSPEGPWEGPSDSDVDLVESHGGRTLYRFHVPAVRARMILSSIPDLVADGIWITVRDVPDATRYDVPLTVGFTRPLTDDDVGQFERLGGRVDYRWDFINALAGILPDHSIADFWSRSDVAYVEAESVSCLASAVAEQGPPTPPRSATAFVSRPSRIPREW